MPRFGVPLAQDVLLTALLNNQAIKFRDSGGTDRSVLLANPLDNFFVNWLDGKAIYLFRNIANAEVGFFGGNGTPGGVLDMYTDAQGALVGSQLADSPRIFERAAIWDGAANAFLSFLRQVDAITAGAAADREGAVRFKFGTFDSEVEFLRFHMAAGPAYSIILSQDLDLAALHLLTTNFRIKEIDENFLGIRNRADSAYRDLILRSVAIVTGYLSLEGTSGGSDIRAGNADDWYASLKARDNGVGMAEIARLVGAADPFFCITGILATIPLSTNLPTGFWTIGYASGGLATLYVNDAGTIKSLTLGTPA